MTQEQVKLGAEAAQAIIIGVLMNGESHEKLADDLNELESLLKTLGHVVCDRVVQKRHKFSVSTLLGKGKIEEISRMAEQRGAQLLVFDHPLTPPQVRNIEALTGKVVMDRTGVILEIFHAHARTAQARTQVEIARLEYLLPRLTGAWTHFQRQAGGGVRSRGMGEKQIEIDRRRARERIARLQRQLEQIRKERQTQRKARANELHVAIVGYTNSGKSTLMKALTKTSIEGKDELFATLDTSIKTIDPRTRPKILLSDTVGFIRRLPHALIESFKSTLDEVLEADLLLHVVDVSHPQYDEHMSITTKVLDEIGAGAIPQLMIFNKSDRLKDSILPRVLRGAYPGSMCISAYDKSDTSEVREHIFDYFKKNFTDYKLTIEPTNQRLQSLIYGQCIVIDADYSDPALVTFHLRSSRATYDRLSKLAAEQKN